MLGQAAPLRNPGTNVGMDCTPRPLPLPSGLNPELAPQASFTLPLTLNVSALSFLPALRVTEVDELARVPSHASHGGPHQARVCALYESGEERPAAGGLSQARGGASLLRFFDDDLG